MSTEGSTEKRTRKYGSKSRTGCITCRQRRLKCDEGKPVCQRCLFAGRSCKKPLSWNNSNAWVAWEPNKVKADTIHEAETIRASIGPQIRFKSDVEDPQLIGFFVDTVGPATDGFFDLEYWSKTSLYAATMYPEVQHLMVASVLLSNRYQPDLGGFTSQVGQKNLKRSMQSYHQGLKALQMTLNTRPTDTEMRMLVLICVKSIVSLELVYGNFPMSLSHLEGAIKGVELARPDVQASLDPEIFRQFKRLDLQVSTCALGRVPLLRPSSFLPQPREYGSGSMEDFARARFDDIGLEVYAFLRGTADKIRMSAPGEVTHSEIMAAKCGAMRLETELHVWRSQFGRLIEMPVSLAAKALRLIYHHYSILLGTCLDRDEMVYDAFEDRFCGLLDDAAELCHRDKVFVVDATTLQPLYQTALKCRRKEIRQKAVDILASTNVQEGVWNARSLCKIAAKAIEIEEQLARDLGEDVPEGVIPSGARIHEIDQSEGRRGSMRQVFMNCRYRAEGPDSSWRAVEAMVEYEH